ncbi:MAG: DUF2924 domain-containing protein [Candidatus Accumulibacter sp.]|nr:DUF2924 domain-containing protein [Accumulibacter sp.]MBO3708504.1 DUF2924 domain-containing protein [Candidatus Accumulibacter conexus]
MDCWPRGWILTQSHRNLSADAKAITGTHWSGPASFGLKRGRR